VVTRIYKDASLTGLLVRLSGRDVKLFDTGNKVENGKKKKTTLLVKSRMGGVALLLTPKINLKGEKKLVKDVFLTNFQF